MNRQRSRRWMLVLVFVLAGATQRPLAQGLALGIKAGTLGLGVDMTLGLTETLSVRASGSVLPFDYSNTIDDIDYDMEVDFSSIAALVDIHPFKNGFRVTAGAMFNDNELTLQATPSENKSIGGHTYTPAQIGTLKGDVAFDDVSPYVGLGYGHAAGPTQRWSFAFDLGVMLQDYRVKLSANGLASSSPRFQQDLREEEQDIQDELDGIKIYPVIAFGIAYRF